MDPERDRAQDRLRPQRCPLLGEIHERRSPNLVELAPHAERVLDPEHSRHRTAPQQVCRTCGPARAMGGIPPDQLSPASLIETQQRQTDGSAEPSRVSLFGRSRERS